MGLHLLIYIQMCQGFKVKVELQMQVVGTFRVLGIISPYFDFWRKKVYIFIQSDNHD